MEHEYQRSKKQIIIMTIFITLIWVVGLLILYKLGISNSAGKLKLYSRIILVSAVAPIIITAITIKKQVQEKIFISPEMIKCQDQNNCIIISYDKIIQIKYRGLSWIPLLDQLSIQSGDEVIYIDFIYSKYKEMWLEILKNLKAIRPHFQIDHRILRRLKVDENLQPIDA